MTEWRQRQNSLVRGSLSLLVAAAIYDAMARSGYFAPALLPTLPTVARALVSSIADGTMIEHAAFTLYRVMFGFSLAVVVGLPLGILMARFQRVEHFFLPLVSALMPIPSFALVPLFTLTTVPSIRLVAAVAKVTVLAPPAPLFWKLIARG